MDISDLSGHQPQVLRDECMKFLSFRRNCARINNLGIGGEE